jgi:hypothetical protein
MKSLKLLSGIVLMGLLMTSCSSNKDWRTASRESSGSAPDPLSTEEAVVLVYGADAWGWRGWFAIHTWIATKRTGEEFYTVYDVVGWRGHRNKPVMRIVRDIPDRFWYGEKPRILKQHIGAGADSLIEEIEQAAQDYPWKRTYTAFPGPNSNTFVAWIAKQVPELDLHLPFSAIGSSYVNKTNQ